MHPTQWTLIYKSQNECSQDIFITIDYDSKYEKDSQERKIQCVFAPRKCKFKFLFHYDLESIAVTIIFLLPSYHN